MSLPGDGVLVVVALGTGAVAYQAWRNRPKAGTRPLSGLMSCLFLWSIAHLVEHHTTGAVNLTVQKLQWVGLAPIAFLWVAFVFEYTDREKFLTRRSRLVLFGVPALLVLSLWVPGSGPFTLPIWEQLDRERGLVFWGYLAVSYGLLALGSGLLLHNSWSLPTPFRRQGLAVLAAVVAGWAGSIVSVFGLFGAAHLHALPLGFALMGGVLLWATVENGLTSVTPIARRTVIETLTAGVVVVDAERRVTSINPTARRLLGLDAETPVVGRPASELCAATPTLSALFDTFGPTATGKRETVRSDDCVVDCELSPLYDGRDRFLGGVLLLYDNTTQRRQQARLERQNERLEKFASIVAHDLRNPLNVARGRVTLAQEDCETPHLEAVERAHVRMEALIDDLLTLARQEERTLELATVELPRVVDQCWGHVETANAELGSVADLSLAADPMQLRQLFENLLRNAVEHGGPNVTVTVGALDDGFYVADDGVGIDAQDPNTVFESGYSTTRTGTGLGLNIVAEVAAAHDWDVHVSRSAAGGARFEFTNVTLG